MIMNNNSIENGFKYIASFNLSCPIANMARVIPQPGQGILVMALKGHSEVAGR